MWASFFCLQAHAAMGSFSATSSRRAFPQRAVGERKCCAQRSGGWPARARSAVPCPTRMGSDAAQPILPWQRRGPPREDQMSGTRDQFEGGCLCGAIRFIATGQPKGVYWCHCQSCRKHSGAPASVFVAFERADYEVTQGEISKFDSTPGRTRRGFCARCGSTLTCESSGLPTETHFHIGAFDRASELQPTRHVFAAEHLAWFPMGSPSLA